MRLARFRFWKNGTASATGLFRECRWSRVPHPPSPQMPGCQSLLASTPSVKSTRWRLWVPKRRRPMRLASIRYPVTHPPGTDQAPSRSRQSHQRKRADCIEDQVTSGGRVLEPHKSLRGEPQQLLDYPSSRVGRLRHRTYNTYELIILIKICFVILSALLYPFRAGILSIVENDVMSWSESLSAPMGGRALPEISFRKLPAPKISSSRIFTR